MYSRFQGIFPLDYKNYLQDRTYKGNIDRRVNNGWIFITSSKGSNIIIDEYYLKHNLNEIDLELKVDNITVKLCIPFKSGIYDILENM